MRRQTKCRSRTAQPLQSGHRAEQLPRTYVWGHGRDSTGENPKWLSSNVLPGFAHAELNNIESFEAAIDADTAAVFIESIQGEGGIYPAENSFLQELRALCDERQVLLMLDEVQCGIGRTGEFLAYQASGIQPDAVGMAKGLGGGFPIGAIWVAEAHAEAFQPGSHGTTFGGLSPSRLRRQYRPRHHRTDETTGKSTATIHCLASSFT